jgi:hypothetical protein
LRNAQATAARTCLSKSVASGNDSNAVVGAAGGLAGPNLHNGFPNGTVTNLLVLIGFAAFAFVVKHVLASMMDE